MCELPWVAPDMRVAPALSDWDDGAVELWPAGGSDHSVDAPLSQFLLSAVEPVK